MQAIRQLHNHSRYAQSIPLLEEELRKNPMNYESALLLGDALRLTGKEPESRMAYDRVEVGTPQNSEALRIKAEALWRLGKHKQAAQTIEAAIGKDPYNEKAYRIRGVCYQERREKERAMQAYDKAISLNQDYVIAYCNRGALYASLRNNERALQDYNKAILLNPNYASAYINRGALYHDMGYHENALQDYDRAIWLSREYAIVYRSRGNLYNRMGNTEKALYDYNMAISLNKSDAETYFSMGTLYQDAGNKEKAVQCYSMVISINKEDADAYYNRANLYKSIGDYSKALQDFNRAISLSKDDADAYYKRGTLYDLMEDKQRALQDYDTAISLNKDHAMAYFSKGALYAERGDNERALQNYNIGISLKKDCAMAYCNRGNLYYHNGDKERAMQDYNRAIQVDNNYSMAYNNRGALYDFIGDKQRALQDYNSSIQFTPNEPLYLCNRARFLLEYKSDRQLFVSDLRAAKDLVDRGIFGSDTTKQSQQFIKHTIDENWKLLEEYEEFERRTTSSPEYLQQFKKITYQLLANNFDQVQKNKDDRQALEALQKDHTLLRKQYESIKEMLMKLEKRVDKVQEELKKIGPLYNRFKGELENDVNIEQLKKNNPSHHQYVITLAAMLYHQCKAFQLIETGLFQENNINESKKAKFIVGQLSSVVGSIPMVGDFAEKLCGVVGSVVDAYDSRKFEETKRKFRQLTSGFYQESKLNTLIISSVLLLVKNPCKIEEISWTDAGKERITKSGALNRLKKIVGDAVQKIQDIKDEIEGKLFRIDIPKESRMRVLAANDLATFLQFVFSAQIASLKPLERIIAEDLLNEEYLPKSGSLLPEGPVQLRNMIGLGNQQLEQYLTVFNNQVRLSTDGQKQWKFVRKGNGNYRITTVKDGGSLVCDDIKLVVSKTRVAESYQWKVTKSECEDGRIGWLIVPVSNPTRCLSYSNLPWYSLSKEKTQVELRDYTNKPKKIKYHWNIDDK